MKIAIASGKGGTGKTTVATNLAYVASRTGRRVAYLDCDVEEPNGHIFLNPEITHREPVGILVPRVDEDECSLCGKCGEICQYSAIVCLGKKVLVFPELCHACGGCRLVCPEDAIAEVLREMGLLETGRAGAIQFVQGILNIGEAMKLSDEDIDDLNRGGLLHDIGKLGISPEILDKPGKLTPEERTAMEKHVRLGARILEPISAYSKIIPIVLQHHERFNGKGYPDGLEGESISLSARIFAVADSFEAMTSDRPYRKAFDRNNAIGIIEESAGNDFDPQVVKAFLKVMTSETRE